MSKQIGGTNVCWEQPGRELESGGRPKNEPTMSESEFPPLFQSPLSDTAGEQADSDKRWGLYSGCHAVYQSLSFPIQSLAWSSLVVQGRSAGLHHLWQSRGTNKTEHSFPDLIPKQPLTAQTQGWLALPHSNLTLQISQALSWVGGQMKHKVR